MRWFDRLTKGFDCWLFGHDWYMHQKFQPTGAARWCCDKCGGDVVQTGDKSMSIPWDEDAAKMYESFGNRIRVRK